MFRRMLLLLLPINLCIKLAVRLAAEPTQDAPYSYALFAVGLVACLATLLCLAPTLCCTSSARRTTLYSYQEITELDTAGVRYDEVEPIDVYINPYRRTPPAGRKARQAFFGEPPREGSLASAASENLDHNAAVFSSAVPLEDLPVI